jgi:hypothetical protein
MALKYHPDKVGQEYAEHFQVITQSYIYLLKKAEDLEKKNISNHSRDMNHASHTPIVGNLLKKDYSQSQTYDLATKIAERAEDVEKRGRKKQIPVKERNIKEFLHQEGSVEDVEEINAGKDFDIRKFNTLFEKYRVEDENQKGYADLLKDGMGSEEGMEDAPIFNQNMNKEIFNAHFDQVKGKRGNRKNEMVLPDAFDSSSKVHCAQIGQSTNFSHSGKYTDIKQAFFEDNVLIDPNQVKSRKDYRNLQELENERSRISHTMDPDVKRIYDAYEGGREREEEERLRYIQNRDDELRAHHQMVSKKVHIHGKKVQ